MSRQQILDDPASACPQLRQFLGGYFHQDWVVERDDWQEIVRDYVSESPRSAVMECAAELRDVLAAGLGEAELGIVLEQLGGSVDPSALGQTTEEWLRAVQERLEAVD
jgi:hypothetical protein